jgi:hypothetical protein
LMQSMQELPRETQLGVHARSSPVWLAARVWIIGVFALVIVRICAYGRFASRLKNSTSGDSAPLVAIVAEVSTKFGVRGIQIILTDLVAAPALYGIYKPKLLFPPRLAENLTRSEVRLIVCHEFCHHRRRDLMSQALIHAAQIIHWFNPLVWFAGRAARNDCELACDEDVVRAVGSADSRTYGETLLKIVSMAGKAPFAPLGVGIIESRKQIKMRIKMIAANGHSSLARFAIGWALLVSISGISLTRESRAEQTSAAIPAVASLPAADKVPTGWWKNGSETAAYAVGIDPDQTHNGQPSAYVKSIVPSVAGFCGMMQMCQAEKFVGKRLRLAGWMKTENANEGGAHLWFRVDGKEKDNTLQFDNMDGRQVKGTTDWQQYSVVLDVPADSAALAYGFFIGGTGRAWVSGVKLEQVGLDVPSTNIQGKKGRALPEAPVNLEFAN